MNLDQVVQKINLIDNVEHLNMEDVRRCIVSEDILVRCDIIVAIARFIDQKEVFDIIIKMLDDRNYLVRCEVCEALSYSESTITLNKLLKRAVADRSSTVRMYAITSMCIIMNKMNCPEEIIDQLKSAYKKEQSRRAIIAYLAIFYTIEKELEYITEALEYINDNDYHIRCNVINILDEIIDERTMELVIKKYKERLLIETAFSVKSSLEQSIEKYQKND